ncbi:MAG TPA: hypothetical protein VFK27_06195 [Bacillales bacterium]|nr:hypothetical protein [Bacillales bacterium]
MEINDRAGEFFQQSRLSDYHSDNPQIFDIYFNSYCRNTEVKLSKAVRRYKQDSETMKTVLRILPEVISTAVAKAEDHFGFSIDAGIHLFVGIYASNAFVDHRGEIYFAIEQLPADRGMLEIIAVHEIIHSYHYRLLSEAGMKWQKENWDDGYALMYLEGVATEFSEQLVPGYPACCYYTYDYDGESWLDFCKSNEAEILRAFFGDAKEHHVNMTREWFRFSGGARFGQPRLGYYVGKLFVRHLRKSRTERETLQLLAYEDLRKSFREWLALRDDLR